MEPDLRSGDALFVFAGDRTILSWNHAVEELTGIPAADAVGRPCWEVLRGVDERGSLVCHPGCSGARLAASGWPVHSQPLRIKTADGSRRPVTVSTIAMRSADGTVFVHLLRNESAAAPATPDGDPPARSPILTRRQLEVLALMDEGCSARTIASRLGIAEATVRNHIRTILHKLHCHSQLEALARARRSGIL